MLKRTHEILEALGSAASDHQEEYLSKNFERQAKKQDYHIEA